ncbi:MAG: TMEM165/GDT1 family protein [Halovenus sp.]
MEAFLVVVVAAFVAQLAVLPGEKVQLIIAALSTRFRPAIVVAAAGLAFGGWTALEILFGQALKGALPPAYLEVISGGLFLLFGLLLLRSMPDTSTSKADGGTVAFAEGAELPVDGAGGSGRVGTFASIFVLMATGEFGDKTQLVTIGLAVQYGAHPGIWVGEMLAIIPVSLANAYLFHRFAHRVDLRLAHAASAALFFFFGADTFLALFTGISIWETVIDAVVSVLPWLLPAL